MSEPRLAPSGGSTARPVHVGRFPLARGRPRLSGETPWSGGKLYRLAVCSRQRRRAAPGLGSGWFVQADRFLLATSRRGEAAP